MIDVRSHSTASGEYLVLGQLLRLEVGAYLAQGPTQEGWDIIFRHADDFKTIQVKTISWPKEKAVNGNLTSGFDYLVVVLLDKKMPHPRFLVMGVDETEPLLSKPNPKRKDPRKRTLTVSPGKLEPDGILSKYEDNWTIML